jgi:hypothetical protein
MNTETATDLAMTYENLAVEKLSAASRLDTMYVSLKDMERRLDQARIMNQVWSVIQGSGSMATIEALERQVASYRESVARMSADLAKAEEACSNAYGELQAAARQLSR